MGEASPHICERVAMPRKPKQLHMNGNGNGRNGAITSLAEVGKGGTSSLDLTHKLEDGQIDIVMEAAKAKIQADQFLNLVCKAAGLPDDAHIDVVSRTISLPPKSVGVGV